jgi:AraC-like DNA-binding protein
LLSASLEAGHFYRAVRCAALPGVEIVRGEHSGPMAGWQFIPMVQIAKLTSGTRRIWSRSQTVLMLPGDLVINAPDHEPRIVERVTTTARTVRVLVAPAVFAEHAAANGGPAVERLDTHVTRDRRLGEALDDLASAVEQSSDGPRLATLLRKLVSETCRAVREAEAASPRRRARPEIARAKQILRERWCESVRLDDLTREVGLSKFHLLRLFHDEVGVPPHAYQMHLRISRAREMLRRGMTVAEVALTCGFADQAHFTRCFKRVVGYTPAAFARLA